MSRVKDTQFLAPDFVFGFLTGALIVGTAWASVHFL